MKQQKKLIHVPMRTCIVTKEKKPKNELARFVLDSSDGVVKLQERGKINGRGANLSLSLDIFDQAVKSNAFSRAFKTRVSPENLTGLRSQFEQYLQRKQISDSQGKINIRITGEGTQID